MKKYFVFGILFVFILSGCGLGKKNIGYNYYKDNKNVYRKINSNPINGPLLPEYNKIEGADPETFEVLNKYISKDKNNIYLFDRVLEGIDYDTFSLKNGSNYAKDKNNEYYIDWTSVSNPVKIIGNADDKLEFVQEDISKKEDKVFLNGEVMQDADSQTFEVINEFYSKDKDYVFISNNIIKDADPDTFEVLEMGYTKDKNNIYYMDKKADVDIETFEFIEDCGCAKDKNHYYYNGIIVDKSKCESIIK